MNLALLALFFLAQIIFLGRDARAQAPKPPVAPPSQVVTLEGSVSVWQADTAIWRAAARGQALRIGDKLRTGKQSRATVRLADLSVLRVNELTIFELLPPLEKDHKPLLDLKSGSLYFFSREKPADVKFRTPTAAGAIRGTEFLLAAATNGETHLALLDGEVELGNEAGTIQLKSGEQARVAPGQAPAKTALIDALNVIQWCLYYPAVVDADEINFSAPEKEALRDSLTAYRAGDLLQALAAFPAGPPLTSEAALTYHAALHLSVGRVDQAERLLQSVPPAAPLAQALRGMIAAVQHKPWSRATPPVLASEWLAQSYSLQSNAQLDEALTAAGAAVAKSPAFGFGWVRVAELEFGFGRVRAAKSALEKGVRQSPRNAQALALQGFLAAAEDHIEEAIACFDRAMAVDGALGNAWLGRGLCRIRRGEVEEGRKDLQVAATLEPQRALLRSYLGKAFAATGRTALAEKDLRLARQLDPNDPTAWLYSALLNQQRNRINEAIRELERSQELNDNRRLFRSKLLVDQDRAVQGANLASIYRDAGLEDVSYREAAKAVNYDYASFSSHLFLANSYEALRDPKLYNLRYETPARSEWYMANLLAPVGAGVLSRNLSQQDYARLFERDRLGLSTSTEYFSNGEWVQSASQYGTFGRVGYSLDSSYRTDPGQRPNNDLEQLQLSALIKAQFTPQDSAFLQAEYFTQKSGDVIQYYSQTNFNPNLRVSEKEEPNVFLGYHHEWNPGSHTLLLASRLDDTLEQTARCIERPFFKFGKGSTNGVTSILPRPFNLDYQRDYTAYSVELQQIWQTPAHAVFAGSRYQAGGADTLSRLTQVGLPASMSNAPIRAASATDMDRISFYGYYQWQVFDPLRLTAGVSYDRLHYPQNVDTPPVCGLETTKDKVSPKVGLVYTPWKNGTFRGMYSRALGSFLHENSVQLEPTQIAGFNQAFRSLIPESAEGAVPGAEFEVGGLGFDQKLPTGTYLGVEGEWLTSDAARLVGAVTSSRPFVEPDRPYSVRETLDFEEKSLQFTAHQLLAQEWSLGARYRLSEADLRARYPDVPAAVPNFSHLKLVQNESGTLHQLNLFLTYNHRCGFFGQFHSLWSAQSNFGYAPARPGDDFWQHHVFLGYRFPNRKAELRVGILNLAGRDYRLNPLNLYAELPRERMFTASVRFNF